MSSFAPRRTSLLFPLVLATLAACQDSTAPQPLSQAKVHFAQGDNNTWTVNTRADPGDGLCDDAECTLREAIAAATSGGKIVFAAGLQGSIDLAAGSGQLEIEKDLSIDGAERITVDAKAASRVMSIVGTNPRLTVKLTGLTLTGGKASVGGGGISVARTSLTLDRVTVSGNETVMGNGGGMDVFQADATIIRSSIIGNRANGDGSTVGHGGGVSVTLGSSLTLVSSTVDGNRAGAGGLSGGGIFNRGQLTITSSTVSNNSASGEGGGLFVALDGTASVVGSTFSGNDAFHGGGMYNKGTLDVRSSTITRNSADNPIDGGGFYNLSTMSLANSIVIGNSNSDCVGATVSLGHNAAMAGPIANVCGFNAAGDVTVQPSQIFTEVLEQDLKDNGGRTKTHALIVRGRAVDAGYCPGETSDQRGFTRPVDDPTLPNAFDACDIGPYEAQGPVAAVADLMISQSVDKPSAKQGDKVTYTIRVQNLGPQTAPSVVVNDVLSMGVTFVEARANRGSLKAPPNGETGTVTWTLGDLLNGANETATITVTVIIRGKTTITNTASVTGAVVDPNAANNSSSIAVSVGAGGTTKGGKP